MEKKEVAVYLYLGVLIVASLLAVYFFNLQLTGFAVVGESGEDFNVAGMENVFYDANTSAIILSENQTTGTYTSNVLDSGSDSIWNNLTWEGAEELEFEVRVCSDINCSNESFASVDLSNINLTGQYFQYKVLFDSSASNETLFLESVSVDYSAVPEPVAVTVSIVTPEGDQDSGDNIPLTYVATGDNLACSYSVSFENGTSVISSTSLSSCANSSFSVAESDEDYTVTVLVVGDSGNASDSSGFFIDVPSEDDEEAEETEEAAEEEVPPAVAVVPAPNMALQAIESYTANPSDSRNLNLVANNNGNVPLFGCALVVGGSFSSWASYSETGQTFSPGESKGFGFSLNVPEEVEEGSYAFPLTVQCNSGFSRNTEFSVDVVYKRVEFNITDVQRTRQDRVVVFYDLEELLDEEQTVELQFFLYDAANVEVANASANQTLSAGESDDFRTNIAINGSLDENVTLTLTANVNAQQYSTSVREPIVLGSPTGFFVLGDDLGTTGNYLAITILVVGGVAVFFFLKRKKLSKSSQ